MDKIMVQQWSFCSQCKGRGCRLCDNSGKTSKLIPLDSLSQGLRFEYERMQKELINGQRKQQAERR